MIHDDAKSPAITKHWYDREGNLVKKTGRATASDLTIASKNHADIEYEEPLEYET